MNKLTPRLVKDTVAPFLRLSARLGWPLGPRASRPGVPYDDRPLALAIAGHSAIPLAEPFGSFGGWTLPRGVAISGEGRIFLADPERRVILVALAGATGSERPTEADPLWPFVPLWPPRPLPMPDDGPCNSNDPALVSDPYTLVEPVDVAISPRGDLAIVDRGARRVLVLAFPSARLRRVIKVDAGTPEAIAFDGHGNLYLALTGPGAIRRYDRLWRHDERFPGVALRQPIALAAATPSCEGCETGCEPIPAAGAVIHVLDGGRLVSLDARGFEVSSVESAMDLAVPPLRRQGGGVLGWQDPDMPGRDPILFHGIALDTTGRHQGSTRPLLAVPRRIEVPRAGRFTTTALDSERTGFQWGRLAFDIDLPANARVVLSTLTSEVEVPFDRLEAVPDDRWSRPLVLLPGDLPEVLVQSGPGRFLWLKVELSGDGTTSPLIRRIDVYGPRRSSLRHLPVPFHDDPESAHFLDRFLGYFDTVFAEIIARHRSMVEFFDPRVVPQEFLAWLGSWFDLEFLAAWPEATRRQMIAQAISYFRQRGTVAGLKRILQWHSGLSDPLPQVIEHFRLPEDTPVMIGGVALDPDPSAHSFTIVLPAYLAMSDDDRAVLERLITASVPAHTRYQLRLIEPGIRIGSQSTIGVDTILGSVGGGALGSGRLGKTMSTGAAVIDAPVHFPQPLTAGVGKGAP
uniref:phage tail protein n=1 Tax=uncultured Halomonas sp. TaxID=173971 RepID=UPI00262CEA13|nr:phage tail protein [uncultured Halomonas sp.]